MPGKTNSSKKIAAVGIVLALAAAGVWAMMSRPDHANSNAPSASHEAKLVKAVRVKEAGDVQFRSFPGVVQASRETKLAFRVGGPLVDLNMKIGQRLNKGDIIARIDERDFRLNIKRLKAAIAEANAHLAAMTTGARSEDIAALEADLAASRAQFAEAAANLERYRNLLEQKAVAQAAFDSAQTAYDTTAAKVRASENTLAKGRRGARAEEIAAMNAQIARLKADLEGAVHALNDTALKAPFDGYINQIFAENFETVSPGMPIVSFMDLSRVEINTSIPRAVMTRKGDWGEINCCFGAGSPEGIPAKIQELGEKTNGPGQTFPLIVTIQTPQGMEIRPGMAADVRIELKNGGPGQNGLEVSASAVFADSSGKPSIWIIDTESMTVNKTPVETRDISKDMIRITGGVQEGDWVVTAGARFLRQGRKVRVMGKSKGDLS